MITFNLSTPSSIRLLPATLLLLLSLGGMNACQAQNRYAYSSNGAEVTDSRTGLIWRRCYEGSTWSGSTCVGTISNFTHEQALAQAKAQTGWRLPNVKEHSSLVDTSLGDPMVDYSVFQFPAGMNGATWSSTSKEAIAWTVGPHGEIQPTGRNEALIVRLVR